MRTTTLTFTILNSFTNTTGVETQLRRLELHTEAGPASNTYVMYPERTDVFFHIGVVRGERFSHFLDLPTEEEAREAFAVAHW